MCRRCASVLETYEINVPVYIWNTIVYTNNVYRTNVHESQCIITVSRLGVRKEIKQLLSNCYIFSIF